MGLIWNLILGAIAGFIATGIMHETGPFSIAKRMIRISMRKQPY